MQPWKISVGFTVIIIAVAAMIGGERFALHRASHSDGRLPLLDGPSVAWRTSHTHAHGCDLRRRPRFGLG